MYRIQWNNCTSLIDQLKGKMEEPTNHTWDNDYTIEAVNNILIIQDNNKAPGEPCKKFYKVEHNSEYTYKVMKTKIKASGGAAGLYNFLKENIENHFAEIWTYNCITSILNKTKEAY